ncbi:hypothetical protein H5S11_00800 [Limosilactobacillus sp. pH52_RY]|uniref:hypothetical protein n=1 Tax=Limosilactobacillus balticus TaxID=2759747 RepID=UPI0015FB1E5E|nr:hypothetical protein [Limosilactobacillus balticus]MBB1109028.1 hypothetical protein [Limosilactobacillus balticus]
MIAYKNCSPSKLNYTLGRGGSVAIKVNEKTIALKFKDVPAENPKYMSVKIFSDPKHIMASIIVDAYLKDAKNDADINQKVKEKLANCINTAVRNRFGLI